MIPTIPSGNSQMKKMENKKSSVWGKIDSNIQTKNPVDIVKEVVEENIEVLDLQTPAEEIASLQESLGENISDEALQKAFVERLTTQIASNADDAGANNFIDSNRILTEYWICLLKHPSMGFAAQYSIL